MFDLSLALVGGSMTCCLAIVLGAVRDDEQPQTIREATLAEVQAFVKERRKTVLTFTGYSGAEYEDPQALRDAAAEILDQHDPETTLINIGATEAGIGAVYELARKKGFVTMGIVSSLAREERVALSKHVDFVFYVADPQWGGVDPQTSRLSPTSAAMVACSDEMVAIGGGDVARDEALAVRKAGKPVTFIPADMNHRLAREKAKKKGQPEPTDFRGSAHAALAEEE